MTNPGDRYSQVERSPKRRSAGGDFGDVLMWERKRKPRQSGRWAVLLVAAYLLLLVPYVIAVNSGESGIVKEVQTVDVASLPSDIQDLLITKTAPYHMILIEDPIYSVKNSNGQVTKERKLIFSTDPALVGDFVRVDNTLTNFHAPPTIVPIAGQSYDTIIIGDVKEAAFGRVVEVMNNLGLAPLLFVSQIIYLAGGLLLVGILAWLPRRLPSLWNIPALVACYSFQFFIAGRIASMNHIETDFAILFFGLLFIPALVITAWVRKEEETPEGSRFVTGLYRRNMGFFRSVSARLKDVLGIG